MVVYEEPSATERKSGQPYYRVDLTALPQHFRFDRLGMKIKLSGQFLCDTDFTWYDPHREVIVCLELKDLSADSDVTLADFKRNKVNGKPQAGLYWLNLSDKIVDSLLMFLAVWQQTDAGLNLKN